MATSVPILSSVSLNAGRGKPPSIKDDFRKKIFRKTTGFFFKRILTKRLIEIFASIKAFNVWYHKTNVIE